jgi:hypothetical protein
VFDLFFFSANQKKLVDSVGSTIKDIEQKRGKVFPGLNLSEHSVDGIRDLVEGKYHIFAVDYVRIWKEKITCGKISLLSITIVLAFQ